MVSTVGVPGRGIASTAGGEAGAGQLRLSVALPPPFGLSTAGGRGGLASPIAGRIFWGLVVVELVTGGQHRPPPQDDQVAAGGGSPPP